MTRMHLLLALLLMLASTVVPVHAQEAAATQSVELAQSDAPADDTGAAPETDAALPGAETTPEAAPVLPILEPAPAPTFTSALAPAPVPSAARETPSLADITSRVSPSVVQVITDLGEGSGVHIASGIITNAHVVQGAGHIEIATSDRRRASATLLRVDANADLALLQTELSLPAVDLEAGALQRQGDEILVIGYPLGLSDGGGQATISRGIISAITTGRNGRALIQTDAAVNHGNSGGAMVNMRGKLIGLPTLAIRADDAQGINFAVGADTISAFLALPQDKVAPSAGPGLYVGDPRGVAIKLADLGSGWRLASEETRNLDRGSYSAVFAHGPAGSEDGILAVYVVVVPDAKAADTFWQEQAGKITDGFGTIIAPRIGDATVAEGRGWIVGVRSRVNNVIVGALGGSATVKSTMDDIAPFVRLMAQRVTDQARY